MDKQKIYDDEFQYKGFWNCNCVCGLKIWKIDKKFYVLCTELERNEGTSITNMAEQLATMIMYKFKILPSEMVWIEHYDYRYRKQSHRVFGDETFDIVKFEFDGGRAKLVHPQWEHSEKSIIEGMIGETLE